MVVFCEILPVRRFNYSPREIFRISIVAMLSIVIVIKPLSIPKGIISIHIGLEAKNPKTHTTIDVIITIPSSRRDLFRWICLEKFTRW